MRSSVIRTTVTSGFRDFLVTMPPKLYLATTMPRLLTQILFFGLVGQFLGGRELLLYALVGNAVVSVAGPALSIISQSLSGTLRGGSLALLITVPTSPHVTIVTWGSGQLFLAFINGLIGLFVLTPLFGLRLSLSALWAIPVLAIITLAVYGLGLVVAAASLRNQGAFFVGSSLLIILYALSGVNFPVSVLPAWLRTISWSLPVSHGLLAIRALVSGQNLDQVPGWAGMEAFVGMLYIALGIVLFQVQIMVERRRGTLALSSG